MPHVLPYERDGVVMSQNPQNLFFFFDKILEASMAQCVCHSPCKPGAKGSIPGLSSFSDETINCGSVSI